MSRTNLKNVQRLIAEAAEAAVAKLAAERKLDADHIKEHAEASRARIDQLARQEQHIIEYIEQAHKSLTDGLRQMFHEMRHEEQQRLSSLQNHLTDITTDEPGLIEHESPKATVLNILTGKSNG